MSVKVIMPALSPTMEEGNLAKWLKKEGDSVKGGEIIAEIETDKATMEYESPGEGVLAKILVKEGTDNVKVNTLIALIKEEGDSDDDLNVQEESPSATAKTETKQEVNPVVTEEENYGETENITVREALNKALSEEMSRDEKVYLIGEEVANYQGAYKISQGLVQKFGDQRVIDSPITEYGFTGIAVGSAYNGLRPIVEYMSFNFSMQAMDHIINSAAKTLYMSAGDINVPIVFRGLNGAGTRVGAQHAQCYASWFSHIPGLVVMAPYSAGDAKGMLKTAVRYDNPVVFLEHEVLYGKSFNVPVDENYTVPIGKAKIEKHGSDVTIVSFSIGVDYAMKAAEELKKEGINAEVINLRTLRPLDIEAIVNSIKKTNRIVSVEEGWSYSGIGSEIAAVIMEEAFDYLDSPLVRVSGKDVPMPYAANLEKLALPSVEDVVSACKKVCYK